MFRFLRFWTNNRKAAATRHKLPHPRLTKCFRPHVEPLEDRLVPASLTWTGANSELWSDAGNWKEGKTPYMTSEADVLYFDEGAARKVSNHDGPTTQIESIHFYDSGYTIKGGDLILDYFGIQSFYGFNRSGTNTLETRTIFIANEFTKVETYFYFNNLVVKSNIAGAGGIFVTGDGTLSLLGNNSYAGKTRAWFGTLVVGSNSAAGSGAVELGGALVSSSPVTLANPISVVGASATIGGSSELNLTGDIAIGIGNQLTVTNTSGRVKFSGRLSAAGGVDIVQNATLTISNRSGQVSEFSGYLYGSGTLRKEGDGYLNMSCVNSSRVETDIAGGAMVVTKDGALGFGTTKLIAGTLAKDVASSITLGNSFVVSGGEIRNYGDHAFTFTGPIEVLSGSTLLVRNEQPAGEDGPAEVRFNNIIRGEGGLSKFGKGVTTLSGTSANTYAGTTKVVEGILVLNKSYSEWAIAGTLDIGDDTPGLGAALVNLAGPNQIRDSVDVLINFNGAFQMNNFDETVGSIAGTPTFGGIATDNSATLTVGGNNNSTTFGGVIGGSGRVVKFGAGIWNLTGNNTYTGGTRIVDGGTLIVSGSIVGPVAVEAGGALGGTGSTGPVTLSLGGAITPGIAGPGVLTVHDLAFSAGSSYVLQLNNPDPGTGYDQLDVAGTVSLNGAALLASLDFSPDLTQQFVIIKNDGTDPVDGTFAGLPQGAPLQIGGAGYHVYYDGGDGNDVVLVRNLPPTVIVPSDQTAFQNVDLPISSIQVGDSDDANLTVILQVSHGIVTVDAIAGLTVIGNGTSSVSLSGSQMELNAALASLLYRPLLNYSGADVLAVKASDGLEITSASVAIRVKSVAEQATDLRAQVNALRDSGMLNVGQANSLVIKLILRGNDGDVGRVQSFLMEVNALLHAGILSPAEADALRVAGSALLTGLIRQ